MPPAAPSPPSAHAPTPSSALLRRRHHDQARLRALMATLRLRLAYAQLKVSHGWHALTIDEVEALYRLRRRASLTRSPGTSETESASAKDSDRPCGSARSTTSTSLTTPDAEVCEQPACAPARLPTDDAPCAPSVSPGPGAAAVWPALGALAGADEDEAWGGLGALVGWPAVAGPAEALLAHMNAISPVQSRSLTRAAPDGTPSRPTNWAAGPRSSTAGATPVHPPSAKHYHQQAASLGGSCGRSRTTTFAGSVFDDGIEISLDDLDGMNWT